MDFREKKGSSTNLCVISMKLLAFHKLDYKSDGNLCYVCWLQTLYEVKNLCMLPFNYKMAIFIRKSLYSNF
jgi:hypothetical protein